MNTEELKMENEENIDINNYLINTIYVTNKDKDNTPELIFNADNGLNINVHIQLVGLSYGIHSLKIAILKNNTITLQNSLLINFQSNVDTRKVFDKNSIDKKLAYSGEVSFSITATAEELTNASILKIFAIIDDKCKKDILVFLRKKNG